MDKLVYIIIRNNICSEEVGYYDYALKKAIEVNFNASIVCIAYP